MLSKNIHNKGIAQNAELALVNQPITAKFAVFVSHNTTTTLFCWENASAGITLDCIKHGSVVHTFILDIYWSAYLYAH
jgi:hypothetical protein